MLLFAFIATWAQAPALIAEAVAPVEADLRACMKSPHPITVIASRIKDGTTSVVMPVYGVGGRGYTPEERCLMKTVTRIAFPALPADVDELAFAWPLAAKDADWDAWRDLSGTRIDHAALGACTRKQVHVVLDLRKGATTAWLPAWQFKAQPKVRACLAKVLANTQLAPLPKGFGLQLAIRP